MSAAKLWLIANHNYTINYEISTVWETKPRTNPQRTSGLLIGPEQVTGSKPCKVYDDDGGGGGSEEEEEEE